MNPSSPNSIRDYLDQVRRALGPQADPALVQDALYDAEEYLRSELAEHPQLDEAAVVARVAESYGHPEEVAEIYRDTDVRVTRALQPPPRVERRSALGRFFGVATDPRAYSALFYMVLSLATGIVFFTVTVTGVSLSLGFSILIIGIPFVILFFGLVRVLALVEGRIVETLLGARMPRRPLYSTRGQPLLQRVGAMFRDPRTWSTLLYLVLQLPLGIAYFTLAVTGLSVAISLALSPIAYVLIEAGMLGIESSEVNWGIPFVSPIVSVPLCFVLGVVLLFAMLHLARGVALMHGAIARQLLVKSAQH